MGGPFFWPQSHFDQAICVNVCHFICTLTRGQDFENQRFSSLQHRLFLDKKLLTDLSKNLVAVRHLDKKLSMQWPGRSFTARGAARTKADSYLRACRKNGIPEKTVLFMVECSKHWHLSALIFLQMASNFLAKHTTLYVWGWKRTSRPRPRLATSIGILQTWDGIRAAATNALQAGTPSLSKKFLGPLRGCQPLTRWFHGRKKAHCSRSLIGNFNQLPFSNATPFTFGNNPLGVTT